jgi:hypothetical protein
MGRSSRIAPQAASIAEAREENGGAGGGVYRANDAAPPSRGRFHAERPAGGACRHRTETGAREARQAATGAERTALAIVNRWAIAIALAAIAAPVRAQETQFQADLRHEAAAIADSCRAFEVAAVGGCVLELATDFPFHVALGSVAPQNGFGFGLAFVEHYTPNESWRLSWNADGVVTPSGAWRTGAYLKMIRTPSEPGIVVRTPGAAPATNPVVIHEYPVFNVYVQAISLDTLFFYGPGQSSTRAGKSIFGERHTILGGNAILPITAPAVQGLRPSFVGAINGRFTELRENTSGSSPSISQLYDENSAPGLNSQPAVLQFEEGLRLKPSPLDGRLRMNYLVDYQQFLAGASSHSSFQRWTVDLKHEIPIYSRSGHSPQPTDTNGPDECFQAVGTNRCPPLSTSTNRDGSIAIRFVTVLSATPGDNRVPFYYQPTLGGSDVNGQMLLAAYDDYRFRAPNLIALQETFEHSIWGPLGIWFLADQGKVAARRGDLSFTDLGHSFAVGMTVRAGGLPLINLSFAWAWKGTMSPAPWIPLCSAAQRDRRCTNERFRRSSIAINSRVSARSLTVGSTNRMSWTLPNPTPCAENARRSPRR